MQTTARLRIEPTGASLSSLTRILRPAHAKGAYILGKALPSSCCQEKHLRIQEVPEMLSQLEHIKTLELVFTGKVVLPEWMDKLTIDNFSVKGKMTETEKTAIRKRFPNVKLGE